MAPLRMFAEVALDSLRNVIVGRREEILQQWENLVHEFGAPKLLPGELRDHLPLFLDDLAGALGGPSPDESSKGSFRPSIHGAERLRAGFDVDAVVREYGLLGDVILRVADSVGYCPTCDEQRTLMRELSEGASRAIAAYVLRRDDDLRKEAGKHLSFVAHELRNPLAAATTALALLKSNGNPAAKPMRVLERSIGRLCDLIDNVLVAGRLEGQVEVRLERIKAGELLFQVCADVLPHAEARGIAIDYEAPASCVVHLDRRLLSSALGNLVHNAIKFTRPDGHVVMRARTREQWVIFEVQDECGGLPPGKAEELFQPFVQRGNDRSGFGLGLAIAQHAVRAHGGRIHVVDRPGVGCTFVIEVPAEGRRTNDAP